MGTHVVDREGDDSYASTYRAGQVIGNVVAGVQGAVELVTAAAGFAAGGGISGGSAGTLSFASATVVTGSAAIGSHGMSVLNNAWNNSANMNMSGRNPNVTGPLNPKGRVPAVKPGTQGPGDIIRQEWIDKVLRGLGTPRINPATGLQQIYGGSPNPMWTGALEWDVPGAKNNITRILELRHYDKSGNQIGSSWGYTTNHYTDIHVINWE